MATTISKIAVGKWNDRTNLDYVPVNSVLPNGVRYNAFGVPSTSAVDPGLTRRPYKIEEAGSVTYIMYDDDTNSDVAIFKTEEI